MTNVVEATVTVNAGQTANASLSVAGDLRFCHIAEVFNYATASSFIDASIPGHKLAFREILDRVRQATPNERMVIVGHTDDVGGAAGNDQLSQRRADAVLAVLQLDAIAWETIFQAERSNAWGDNDFRTMLQEVNGTPPTQAEVNSHRANNAAGAQLRGTLFGNYFNALLGNPASSLVVNLLTPPTLACGERHTLGSGNHAPSRRAEVFFFRDNSSPVISCNEYPNWLQPCQVLPPVTPTVTIANIDRIIQGQIERVQVTVTPSPLPMATTVTLELSTRTGSGAAEFVSTNSSTMVITGSQAVRIRAVTTSSQVDNIRITAKETGAAAILAQEDFTVVTTSSSPQITLSAPVVLVKKIHTNPARQTVILRLDPLSAQLTGSGLFTRSNDRIRFFTAANGGTEILFNGTDNVFTDAQLNAGITLFTEGVRPSGALNDVQLTLTFRNTAGGQIGNPATATLTAVELTLDIAISRTNPAVDPAPMTAVDKINTGRFVQVGDPGHTHERAMLIVRQAQPAAFNGELELKAVGPRVALFAAEQPAAGQVELNSPRTLPNSTIPANGTRFFVEGKSTSAAARDAGYQLGIRNLEADGDRVNITVVQIEISATAAPAAPSVTFVRFGLWDNAFRAPGAAGGPIFNSQAEADNFAGADTRRFHIKVRDIAARSAGHVQIDWLTLNNAGGNLDAPSPRDITLVETPANSGVFISRGLLLVTDTTDQNQSTHSGMAAGLPDAGAVQGRGTRNHRLRRGSMTGSSRVVYRRIVGTSLTLQLPIFQRNPETRRRLPLQIFVLRIAPGGPGVVPTAAGSAIWGTDLRVIRETYERIGITVETVVAPGTPAANTVTVGGDQLVLVNPPAGVAPGGLLSFANETALSTSHPALHNTIRVFFVAGLTSGNGGESYTDADAAGFAVRGAVFTIQGTGPYAAAHEVGHILVNKSATVNTGHYNRPAVPAGNRLENDQNLMKRQFLGAERVDGPKRLWDVNDADAVNQVSNMRGSHYTRNF